MARLVFAFNVFFTGTTTLARIPAKNQTAERAAAISKQTIPVLQQLLTTK
jgi:hypothetical protein